MINELFPSLGKKGVNATCAKITTFALIYLFFFTKVNDKKNNYAFFLTKARPVTSSQIKFWNPTLKQLVFTNPARVE